MSRVDCHLLDERLMDYLYEELGTHEMDEMRAHVEGCPRCSAEIGRFRGVRKAVAQLEMAEPPPAVSAKLMHQAAQSHKQSMWRRSRAVRATVYAAPIVAMAAAFLLLVHVKDKAMSPEIHADDVKVTIDGEKTAEGAAPVVAPAAEPPSTIAIPPARHDVTLADRPADDLAKAEEAEAPKAKSKGGLLERKVEFKPPVTKDTKLGKATVAHGKVAQEISGSSGPVAATPAPAPPPPARAATGTGRGAMHVAPSTGGEDFDAVLGGAMNKRDTGGAAGGKAGGDVAFDKTQPVEKPGASKPRELAKKEGKKEPDARNYYPRQPSPPPATPQAAPQLTTAPQGAQSNEGYIGRYRNAPPPQQAPKPIAKAPVAANSEPEMDEARTSTESMAQQTRREQQKQVTTPPDQLYSQLVTSTNNGNDCGKVMDLVKQLESWNYWGNQHPNEMRNAYQLRGRCQTDNNMAQKDYENANRIQQEQTKRASKKAAPAKSKASDNASQAPAEAAPAKK